MNRGRQRWWRDESAQEGADYGDPAVVAKYDLGMSRFRNAKQEWQAIARALALGPGSTVIDMGAGTGTFALQAARVCRCVYAVDISAAMLDHLRRRARTQGARNVRYHHAGLLSYSHRGGPVDAVVCQATLHHLPDFWKAVALSRMSGMLRKGGMLFLMDVVFSFHPKKYAQAVAREIGEMGRRFGREAAEEYARHFRDEFSTFDWVMEGILERTGFEITKADYTSEFKASYVCRRR